MRITVDYDPKTQNFAVLVDRGALSGDEWPWPPPPPINGEFQKISSEMMNWLNDVFQSSLSKFEKDDKLGAIRYLYDPKAGISGGYEFRSTSDAPPTPPPFVK